MKSSTEQKVVRRTFLEYSGILLCSLLLLPGYQALAQTSGNPTAPVTGLSGNYRLFPQNGSSICLDVYGGGLSAGTNVDIWSCNGGSNQSFTFVSQGNGIYQIQPSYASSLCLDVYGGANVPGTHVDAWSCTGGSNQQWSVISDGGGIYELAPQNAPGLRLDVYGASTSPGTQIDVWSANGGSNQKFLLVAQTVNSDASWGISQAAQIEQWNGYAWTSAPGLPNNATASQVSAGADGTVYALDTKGNIYSYNNASWSQQAGQQLAQISVGSANNVWGINASSQIYQWNGSAWTLIPNMTAKQVSAGSDGTVYALDANGNIYTYSGTTWSQQPGQQLAQISVGSANNVWGVNASGQIYQWNGSVWTRMPGTPNNTPKQVSAGADGTVYALDSANLIYSWMGTTWQTITGFLVQISTGFAARCPYNNSAVTTQGSWSTITSSSAAAGGYLQDSSAGDTITFKFTGDSVALYRLVDPKGGTATVTVDGSNFGSFDFYFPQQRWQIPAVLDHLGAGPHTLVLTIGAQSNPASTGHNIYIDTFAAPAPFFPTVDEQTAISRVNFYRNPLGSATPPMPAAALTKGLNLAAQAAALFNSTNMQLTHIEDPTLPDFVGAGPGDRFNYFGYGAGGSEDAFQGVNALGSIDGWMDTVYHRTPILTYGLTDIGFGLSQVGTVETVMDFGNMRQPPPTSRLLNPYPVNGQTSVPLAFTGGEDPNPLPANVTVTGYPISLRIEQPANVVTGSSTAPNTYSLTDSSGNKIPVYTLDAGSDPNKGYLSLDDFFMLPQNPLNAATTYTAHITGTDSQRNAFDVSWSFTTVPNSTITITGGGGYGVDAPGQYSAQFAFSTAGPVVSTQVQYGTTPAYGMMAAVTPITGSPNTFMANLTGLTKGVTYHYQVSATDAQSVTSTTPDETLILPLNLPFDRPVPQARAK